jgi:hypothetical protein
MSDDAANPFLNKKVAFVENTHQHAKLILKLRHDGVTQSKFFRAMIAGYIDDDERIQSYIDEIKPQNKKKKAKSKQLRDKGKQMMEDFGLKDGEIENIFDLIEEEHPEL